MAASDSTRAGQPAALPLAAGRFEELYAELQRVVERLDEGGLGLEDAMRLFERGVELARECERIVETAELRVTRLLAGDSASADDASTDLAF